MRRKREVGWTRACWHLDPGLGQGSQHPEQLHSSWVAMARKIQRFAIFCWTHASLDRTQRIEIDSSPELACQLSQTIRVQYEGAKARVNELGGEVVATFFYEETGHQPTEKVALKMLPALMWCIENSVAPVVNELSEYRERGFNFYKRWLDGVSPSIGEIMFYEASPDERSLTRYGRPMSLEEFFNANRDREANARKEKRRQRLRKKRLGGLRRAIRRGAKIGFAAAWAGKVAAAERGRMVQRKRASDRAETVMTVIASIKRAKPTVSLSGIAAILNEKAKGNPKFRPARAPTWNADSVRMLVRRQERRRCDGERRKE